MPSSLLEGCESLAAGDACGCPSAMHAQTLWPAQRALGGLPVPQGPGMVRGERGKESHVSSPQKLSQDIKKNSTILKSIYMIFIFPAIALYVLQAGQGRSCACWFCLPYMLGFG